jgi:hypothetical protein
VPYDIGGAITIRPGSGVDSVLVKLPDMDEFETGPGQLRDWLREHGLVQTPQQWTRIDQLIQDAIQGRGGHGNHPGDGAYEWDDYRHDPSGLTVAEEERFNERQSQDWTRMLNAWEQFHQQVRDLRSIADGDGDEIIRQVGHTITALNMVENSEWSGTYSDEYAEWVRLSAGSVTRESLHTAAHSIVEAGEALYSRWHDTVSAGDYDYHTLLPSQHGFVKHCEEVRRSVA